MIFHRLGLLNKNQRGFTLIELILAIAITGGITMAIFQVFTGNTRSTNHMIAVKQVQNAGYWLSRDTQMARDVVPGDDGDTGDVEILTLTWVGWERTDPQDNQYIDSYKVRYTYDAASNKLWRRQRITTEKHDKNGQWVETIYSPSEEGWDTAFIADYISPILEDEDIYKDGNKLIVTVRASVGEAEEERTYEITPRPST